jgi:hypothetical protein
MQGVYQHCDEQHLQRYLAEFDFRYSNRTAMKVDDFERTVRALAGVTGKRLTYKKALTSHPSRRRLYFTRNAKKPKAPEEG